MAVIHRQPKPSNRKCFNLIAPLFYLSSGVLIGFMACFIWIQTPKTPFVDVQSSSEAPPLDSSVVAVIEDEERQQDFFAIAESTGTDKVAALGKMDACLKDDSQCTRPSCKNPKCRPWGHFYQTIYQSRLGHLSFNSTTKTEPFQMLEIGFFHGRGYEAFSQFFPRAELHSMEISCLPKGPTSEGKWPHGNFAARNRKWYGPLRQANRLHCGDASQVEWLDSVWQTHMWRRPNNDNNDDASPPPLKLVIDDGSHLSKHMVQSFFFWFPRIEPGGFLVVEDVQPTKESNKFRTQFLPQIMSDLHYCGDPKQPKDDPCFPLIQTLLQSVHCEMHICIFGRNEQPAIQNLTLQESKPPRSALSLNGCKALRDSFGLGL